VAFAMNLDRLKALKEEFEPIRVGYKNLLLVMKRIGSKEYDAEYFRLNFIDKQAEIKSKLQPLFDNKIRAVYCHENKPDQCIGNVLICKSVAWQIDVTERELLEKLGFDADHWSVFLPLE
jgi:hypothetical protein